ncbi:MAG TPA: type VI secretion system baseplate subunit TssG [Aliidongia sp.]|nr:type VI secretion system baseplate subunit TssG [Aliidongia sp.]
MADDGRATPGLVELLAAIERAPHDFDFFQALRRIEAAADTRPRLGRSARPVQDAVRLGQVPSLLFAPSTIASVTPAGEDGPARLQTYSFGLFGPNGPLPLHLTEYAHNRQRNNADPTFAAFVDLFHHRLASLFYRAWAASQPVVNYDRPDDDRFAMEVGSLLGIGMESMRDRDMMPDDVKLHFTGRLAHHARNAEGLRAILGDFFRVPVEIEEFVPRWASLPPQSLCLLGASPDTGTLGSTATAGARIHVYHHKFRILIGPIGLADYQRLLPGGTSLGRLVPIVRNYIGDELDWDVNLILFREEVPQTRLGMAGQLGWTSWIGTRRAEIDADELLLNPYLRAA